MFDILYDDGESERSVQGEYIAQLDALTDHSKPHTEKTKSGETEEEGEEALMAKEKRLLWEQALGEVQIPDAMNVGSLCLVGGRAVCMGARLSGRVIE